MPGDIIEREIVIHASVEHVWSLVSKTGYWIGDGLRFDIEAREGETVTIEATPYGRFPVRVERLDAPRYAAYRWASVFPAAESAAGNSTLVEITLIEHDDGVLLRLTESGFAALDAPVDFLAAKHIDNEIGWDGQLARLQHAAESVPAA